MVRRTLALAAILALILVGVGRLAVVATTTAEAATPSLPASGIWAKEGCGSTVGAVPSAEEPELQRYHPGEPGELCALDALQPLPARFAPTRRIAAVRLPRHDRRVHDTALDPGFRPPIPLSD
jgi:hypothetical protein